MNSALYECTVMHERLEPRRRHFAYRVFYLWLDLAELDEVAVQTPLLRRERGGFYTFRDGDHWPVGGGCLPERIQAWFAERGVRIPDGGGLRMLAIPRVAGYAFNPISFYFVVDRDGQALAAAAEVENTFRERKLYLLPPSDRQADGGFRTRRTKDYYVSPFLDLDLDFEFRFRLPGETLDLRVNDLRGDDVVFKSVLTGHRRELTTRNLLRLSFVCPLVSLKVIALIHWQALQLWLAGHPWFPKAARPERQREVIKPHRTIAQLSS